MALDYGAERRKLRMVKLRGVRYRGGTTTTPSGRVESMCSLGLIAAEHHTPFDRGAVLSGVPRGGHSPRRRPGQGNQLADHGAGRMQGKRYWRHNTRVPRRSGGTRSLSISLMSGSARS